MKCRIAAPLALGLAGLALAVDVKPQNNGFAVAAPGYSAFVSSNGSLSSLKAQGAEFLNSSVSFSRGTYFYQDGVVDLGSPELAAPSEIVAEGPKAKVRYRFADAGVALSLENKTDRPMSFFFILGSKANAAAGPDGEWQRAPVSAAWKSGSWLMGAAKIAFRGITQVWGPWDGGTQVVECILAGRASTEVSVHLDKAGLKEMKRTAELSPEADYSLKPLTVVSPRNLQVFQRQTRGAGRVLISGRAQAKHDKVEFMLEGAPLMGKLPKGWQPISADPVTGSFNASLNLPAGGWYKLTVRATLKGKPAASAVIKKFGVGEVFVTAGQSNSTNSGQFRTKQTSGMVSSFSGTDWRLADDPQPGPHDGSQGGSPWPAFGDAMFSIYKVPIGIAVTGHGGTSVNQWQPGGELHNWMMARIWQLGPGGFRAVLWHQGESDANMAPEEYFEKMARVVGASTRLAGWEFPWFVAQASYHSPANPSWPKVRAAQKMLWDRGVALAGPDTDTLTGDNRDYGGKGIHFSPKGLAAHGKMWADCVRAWLDKALKE